MKKLVSILLCAVLTLSLVPRAIINSSTLTTTQEYWKPNLKYVSATTADNTSEYGGTRFRTCFTNTEAALSKPENIEITAVSSFSFDCTTWSEPYDSGTGHCCESTFYITYNGNDIQPRWRYKERRLFSYFFIDKGTFWLYNVFNIKGYRNSNPFIPFFREQRYGVSFATGHGVPDSLPTAMSGAYVCVKDKRVVRLRANRVVPRRNPSRLCVSAFYFF